ncbi:hypothetical protein [Mangrovibacter plantisponsor]|nr:hypothetical protein [Mangrovibacter plantisponsor]
MTLFERWLMLAASTTRHTTTRLWASVKRKADWRKWLFSHLDYRVIIRFTRFMPAMVAAKGPCHQGFEQTHRHILGRANPTRYRDCIIRQKVLRNSLVYGNPALMKQLAQCASKIRQFIDGQALPCLPIFAPMHTVSDVLAGALPGFVTGKPITVVSVHDDIGSSVHTQQNNTFGLALEQFDPGKLQGDNGTTLASLVERLLDQQTSLVIFPDALPECTTRLAGRAMSTQTMMLFGKTAAIHTGLATFSRVVKHPVLFYCLFINGQNELDVDILDYTAYRELHGKLPAIIEHAIQKYSHEWLLWHYTSFFYFHS